MNPGAEIIAAAASGKWLDLHCGKCGFDTSTLGLCEYYFVRDKLWRKHSDGHYALCVGCFEENLGRRLRHGDFKWEAPANTVGIPRSDRLLDRMTKGGLSSLKRGA